MIHLHFVSWSEYFFERVPETEAERDAVKVIRSCRTEIWSYYLEFTAIGDLG